MQIHKYIPTLLIATVLCIFPITGCDQEDAKLVATPPTNVVENEELSVESTSIIESTQEEIPIESEVTTEETSDSSSMLLLTITIENQCGADIGMFSVIDPVTKEQVNVEGILDGDSLSIQANWPTSITDFQWAIYNKYGELYTESATNISQAKESVVITLQGEGSIDNINTTFQ